MDVTPATYKAVDPGLFDAIVNGKLVAPGISGGSGGQDIPPPPRKGS
jgi:hypothetical protein